MLRTQNLKKTGTAFCVSAVALMASSTWAQQPASSQSVGISTGLVFNDNRGLDDPSQGDTTEAFSLLDFNIVRSDPLQSLALSGSVTLRAIDGAEADSIQDGLTNPNLRLRYNRSVRNSELTFSAFGRESETSTLVEELDGIDLTLVNETATRLTYGFDTSLELGKAAPFGVTLSVGYTGLRFSDTTSTSLQDQDRTRLGANFRFDINPVLQARVNTRYTTFDEEGAGNTLRETFALDASINRSLSNGSVGASAGVTSVEEGERYRLAVTRRFETALWQVGGSLGVEQSVGGNNFASGELNIGHSLPNGSLQLNVSRGLRSGLQDSEQEFTSVRFAYAQNLDALSSVQLGVSYRETDPTGAGNSASLGTIGVNYQRALAPGWSMNLGVDHRVNTASSGTTARDNRLSLSVRRELTARP